MLLVQDNIGIFLWSEPFIKSKLTSLFSILGAKIPQGTRMTFITAHLLISSPLCIPLNRQWAHLSMGYLNGPISDYPALHSFLLTTNRPIPAWDTQMGPSANIQHSI